jgi:type II secretory pathway pseudopilin PulG
MVLVLAVLALAIAGLVCTWLRDSRQRQSLAELQRQSAERRSRKPSASTTPTRPPFCV